MYEYHEWKKKLVLVRGAGDIATGTLYKLHACHIPVLALEIANPSCIRRTVSFCEAVFDGEVTVEGIKAKKACNLQEAYNIYKEDCLPVMIDPDGAIILHKNESDILCNNKEGEERIVPAAVVDAILAKRNLGTKITDAEIVIAVGPGFCAGKEVHAVVETKRGHDLGRVLYEGSAFPNSGVPGNIAGYTKERVIHAPASGRLKIIREIGSQVMKGECIARIDEVPVYATISGILRGMLRDGYPVHEGLKMADIDPRLSEKENYLKISDKARCIAGGVLEALFHLGYC